MPMPAAAAAALRRSSCRVAHLQASTLPLNCRVLLLDTRLAAAESRVHDSSSRGPRENLKRKSRIPRPL
ncbi:unnamed protein product [Sphagnum jensenii]|uniref:Uncharacterized protein n=1 Tax=Sphagnum jensenii TaxID=128206 RepID=A0ABP0XAE9_9BRYO